MIRTAVFRLTVAGVCLLLATTGFGADNQDKESSKEMSDAASKQSTQKSSSEPASGEEINWQVISSGGGEGISTSTKLNGTVGQVAVGQSISIDYGINHGYWQIFGQGGACCDRNGGCSIETLADCASLNHLYMGDGTTCDPGPCSPVGACCRDEDGLCVLRTEWYCEDVLGRTYMGDGVICDPSPCDLGCCVSPIRGNVNGDGSDLVNIGDLTYLVAFLFGGGPAPPCDLEGNVNGDAGNLTNIADLTYLVAYLFGGGAAPASCP